MKRYANCFGINLVFRYYIVPTVMHLKKCGQVCDSLHYLVVLDEVEFYHPHYFLSIEMSIDSVLEYWLVY